MSTITPIGNSIKFVVGPSSTSTTVTANREQIISAVLITNVDSGTIAYAQCRPDQRTVNIPSTTVSRNVTPILGLQQLEIGVLQTSTMSATVYVNAIAESTCTLILTPLF